MSNRHVLNVLFPDQPYFGGATAGIQGEYVRHVSMSSAISLKAAEAFVFVDFGNWVLDRRQYPHLVPGDGYLLPGFWKAPVRRSLVALF